MAVKIRLLRMGKIRNPQYRIVVADSRTKRDGRAIEYVGIYHPKEHPSIIQVKADRVKYWLSVGAQPSQAVQRLLEKTGDWQLFKGLPAPPPLLMAPEKVDRLAVYEAESKAAAGLAEAITPRSSKKGKADAGKTDAAKTDAGKTDAAKTDAGKTDAAKADAGKADAGKVDAGKVDVDKAVAETQAPQETPKVTDPASPATSTPHTVAQDAAAPKADSDLPKVDAADTRTEAAAKAEDPAGAGAGDAS